MAICLSHLVPNAWRIPELAVVVTCAVALVLNSTCVANAANTLSHSATSTERNDKDLETYRLADRSNLRRLANGDFLFRLAKDLRNGIVYWAYNGTTRHIIAVAPDRAALADHSFARSVLIRITDLPKRVGCGVGLIHRSWVYVVPGDAGFGESGLAPEVSPVFVKAEVRNDVSGRTPTAVLFYRNIVAGQ